MEKSSKIYIAGHTGMVGSALVRQFKQEGYTNLLLRTHQELDLLNQQAVFDFLKQEKPDYIIIAAARVGGIMANDTYRAQFIYENLAIETNLIHGAHLADVDNLLFLGSSCIYPRDCPQPMKEEYLLTGPLEKTNEPYAIAKIAGIKLCENYYRQYGRNYFSVMPTNLYGPNDNYNLKTSHVLPALLRKTHLAHLLEMGDFDGIRYDLKTRPFATTTSYGPNWANEDIIDLLENYGIFIIHREPLKEINNDEQIEYPVPTPIDRGKQVANSIQSSNPPTIQSPSHPFAPAVVNPNKSIRDNPRTVSLKLWGSGKPKREFLHVDDLADACVYLLENLEAKEFYSSGITHINIGSGRDLSIRELALTVKKMIGYQGEVVFDSSKPDGTMQKLLNVERLHKLGWGNKIDLAEGLKRDYDWYNEQIR